MILCLCYSSFLRDILKHVFPYFPFKAPASRDLLVLQTVNLAVCDIMAFFVPLAAWPETSKETKDTSVIASNPCDVYEVWHHQILTFVGTAFNGTLLLFTVVKFHC